MTQDILSGSATRSTLIGDLAAALALAQGQIKGALKDSNNPFFKSRYADLASVWGACRAALSANGLAIVQTTGIPIGAHAEAVRVITTLMHSSGQWISGELEMIPVNPDPQGVGSAITYARRYALAAIVGVSPEDDDGNAASGKVGAKAIAAQALVTDPAIVQRLETCLSLSSLQHEFGGLTVEQRHAHGPVKDACKARLTEKAEARP